MTKTEVRNEMEIFIALTKYNTCSGVEKVTYCLWFYLPTPPLGQDMTQGQFLSGV